MPDDPRITKLEEGVAFNERAIEELSAELAKAYERIAALAARLDDLGTRLGDLERADPASGESDEVHPPEDPGLERPPHAAGPRD